MTESNSFQDIKSSYDDGYQDGWLAGLREGQRPYRAEQAAWTILLFSSLLLSFELACLAILWFANFDISWTKVGVVLAITSTFAIAGYAGIRHSTAIDKKVVVN